MTDDIEQEPPEYHDLFSLLSHPRKVSIATLATAIEKEGIQGWDRFGRFDTFKVDDPKDPEMQAAGALRCLELQYVWDGNVDNCQAHEESPLDRYAPDGDRGSGFGMGWREGFLPDFSTYAAEQASAPVRPVRNPSADAKAEGNNLRIIGGLLAFIKGELGNSKHADFKTERDLIDLLADKLEGYGGTKSRNLQEKFAEAKRLLK